MTQKIRTYGLTHIALAVSDLSRAVGFYQDVFGATIMYQEETFAQIQTSGSNDIIVFEKNEELAGQGGLGIKHFGFRLMEPVAIEVVVEAVVNAGGTIKEQGEFVKGEPYVFFYDPDGYEIEVWYEKELP